MMKKYITPVYETENIETSDIVLASIQSKGQGTIGEVSGEKGAFELVFGDIL